MKNIPKHKIEARIKRHEEVAIVVEELMSGGTRGYDREIPSRQVARQIARNALKVNRTKQIQRKRREAGKALEMRQGADTGIRKAVRRAITRISRVTITMSAAKQKRRLTWADAV